VEIYPTVCNSLSPRLSIQETVYKIVNTCEIIKRFCTAVHRLWKSFRTLVDGFLFMLVYRARQGAGYSELRAVVNSALTFIGQDGPATELGIYAANMFPNHLELNRHKAPSINPAIGFAGVCSRAFRGLLVLCPQVWQRPFSAL